jgi:hypothetical protein
MDWDADFDFASGPSAELQLDIRDSIPDDLPKDPFDGVAGSGDNDAFDLSDVEWPSAAEGDVGIEQVSELAMLLAAAQEEEPITALKQSEADRLPSRYRLLKPRVDIIKFDKPPPLWCTNPLHSPVLGNGWERSIRFFRDSSEVEGWIGGLLGRHANLLSPHSISIHRLSERIQSHRSMVQFYENEIETYFVEWVRMCMGFCFSLYYTIVQKEIELAANSRPLQDARTKLWFEIFRFFEILYRSEKEKKITADTLTIRQMLYLTVLISTKWPVNQETSREYEQLKQKTFKRLGSEGREVEIITQFHCGLLDTATTLVRLAECLNRVISHVVLTSPSLTMLLFDLAKRGLDGKKLDPPSASITEEIQSLLSDKEICDMASILSSMYFCAINLSPIHFETIRRDDEEDDSENDESSFMEMYSQVDSQQNTSDEENGPSDEADPFKDIQESPSTPRHRKSEGMSALASFLTSTTKKGASSRMSILFHLYPLIPLNAPPKAIVAYALADYSRKSIGIRVSEKFSLEALVVLDVQSPLCPSLSPLFTDLGTCVMAQFCETMQLLEKISYAAVGWRVCAALYHSQQRMQKYIDILSRVAAVSAERLDQRRAIVIYRDILEYYISQNKTNEVWIGVMWGCIYFYFISLCFFSLLFTSLFTQIVYVSEVISNLYIEIGRFHHAESALLTAITLLSQSARGQTRTDELLMKLALVKEIIIFNF